MPEIINCVKCINYKVTWDVKFPHGCKLWGIISKKMPAYEVFQSLGKNCPHFTPKNNLK